jgi:hypothetical protein
MAGGQVKRKKAAKILKSQDRRFARQGGAVRREWLESPDRAQLALAAGTRAAKAALGRYQEHTTGVNPVRLAKDVGRELRKQGRQAEPDPFGGWLLSKAAGGDKAAADLLDRLGGPPAWQVQEHAEQILKSSASGEARRLAAAALEDMEKESMAEYQRQQALRKEGWSRP